MNSLKLLIATVLVVMMSFIIKDPIFDFVVYKGASTATAYIVELLSVVIIDAIIYLVVLRLLKEDLVSSFLRRKKSDNA